MEAIVSEFFAGDSFELLFDLPEYPASEGWDITYRLVGASNINIAGSIVDNQYSIEETPVNTALWAVGDYWCYAVISLGGDKKTIKLGRTTIKAALSGLTTLDNRSHVKKTLDALEAMIEGKATKDVLSYSIAGRSLEKMSFDEILKLQSTYQRKYELELQREKKAQGLKSGNRVVTRFT